MLAAPAASCLRPDPQRRVHGDGGGVAEVAPAGSHGLLSRGARLVESAPAWDLGALPRFGDVDEHSLGRTRGRRPAQQEAPQRRGQVIEMVGEGSEADHQRRRNRRSLFRGG